jgi:hypothetical protein
MRENMAPWGSPNRMRALAGISVAGGLSFIIAGLFILVLGTHRYESFGLVLMVMGTIFAGTVLVLLPLARRSGKL